MTLIEEEEIAVIVKKTLADALPISNTPGPVDVTGEGGFAALSLLYIDARGDLFIKEQQNQPLVWDGTDITIGPTNSDYAKISGTGFQFFNGTEERFRIDPVNNVLSFYDGSDNAVAQFGMNLFTDDNTYPVYGVLADSEGIALKNAGALFKGELNAHIRLWADNAENGLSDPVISFGLTSSSAYAAKGAIRVDNSDGDSFKIESSQASIKFSQAAKRIDLESTDIFSIADQASKVAPGANHSGLTSINGELYAVDASGTETIIIPHEEGTWTPVIVRSGETAFNGTYSTQVGDYVRIGDVVHASCLIILSGVTESGNGNIQITGLPFAKNQDDYQHIALIGYNDIFGDPVTRAYHVGSGMQIIQDGVTQSNYAGVITTGYLGITTTYTTDG